MKIKSKFKSLLFSLLLFGSLSSFIYLNFFTQQQLVVNELKVDIGSDKYLPDLKIVTGLIQVVKKTMH